MANIVNTVLSLGCLSNSSEHSVVNTMKVCVDVRKDLLKSTTGNCLKTLFTSQFGSKLVISNQDMTLQSADKQQQLAALQIM